MRKKILILTWIKNGMDYLCVNRGYHTNREEESGTSNMLKS